MARHRERKPTYRQADGDSQTGGWRQSDRVRQTDKTGHAKADGARQAHKTGHAKADKKKQRKVGPRDDDEQR